MKLTAVPLLVGALGIMLSAHDVFSTKITWSREISRLVYKRCASCHRDGGSSFALVTFEQARPWAKAIKEEVLERRMPPYAAIKGFGDLRDDHALTQEEIHLISDWVEGGSPEGDRSLLPKDPEFGPAPVHGEKTGTELLVDGSLTLKQPMTFAGVRPKNLADGVSVKVVADRPDGTIEPLIWLYDYKPKFARPYYFRAPVRLPAGTKIETYPAASGGIALLAQK
ncbi:MAG TPA: hypothetical protein VEU96_22425 [Bryobacteraceae bacterium]|nr:hypothetical protein [Bryobacteraceae bacterium]